MSAIQQAAFWHPAAGGGAFALPYTMDFTGGLAALEALGFTFVVSDTVNNSVAALSTYSGFGGSALYPARPDTDATPFYPDPPPTSGGNYLRYSGWSGWGQTLTINLPAALIAQSPRRVGFWSAPASTGGGGAQLRAYDAASNYAVIGDWPGGGGGVPLDFGDTPNSYLPGMGVITKLTLAINGNWLHLDDITFYAEP